MSSDASAVNGLIRKKYTHNIGEMPQAYIYVYVHDAYTNTNNAKKNE